MNNTDARLWHPWLRINRVLRVMLHTRWNAEAWSVVRVEFRRALALRSQIRRAGWFIHENALPVNGLLSPLDNEQSPEGQRPSIIHSRSERMTP